MSVYDTTRETIYTLINAFHVASSYTSLEINFPGRMITDVENMFDPFVHIELDMSMKDMSLPSRHCVRVEGMLSFNHFARKNSGAKIFNAYTDALMDYFGLRTLDSITFLEVQPYSNKNIEGFDGKMNSVMFSIDYFNI